MEIQLRAAARLNDVPLVEAAGCLAMAESTGRLLLPFRSGDVQQPHTWGTWGGSCDQYESPTATAIREFREETGYLDKISLMVPLYVFKRDNFRYYNFLIMVPQEFEPQLNWETERAAWIEYGDWPQPMHPGLRALTLDSKSASQIQLQILKLSQ